MVDAGVGALALRDGTLVDQARARRAQVTSLDIANTLNTYFDGARITDFRESDTPIPIVLRAANVERDRLSSLADINVYSTATSRAVPLLQIATAEPVFEYSVIQRRDQERTLTVEAKHVRWQAGELLARLRPTLAALAPAPGHRWELGGELEKSAEAQKKLFAAGPACLAAIVLLLVWQFNSFRRPLIILLTIPLAFIGAVVGLFVMRALFGFMAILGLFSLAGIIINNGIVLIDRIKLERAAGVDPHAAVVNACVRRLRPILMTTLTTVLGLLPLILFGGALWYAMACVIAFGLALGTVLTLGVVPALYTLLFRIPVKGEP